jgi:cbb3-type cytochrome oxidase subunit 3
MLCTDTLEEKENRYNVLKIENHTILYQVMPMFNQQLKNNKFSDYVECFSKDNAFYVVFKHHGGNLLAEEFSKRNYSLNERLIILKNLLEKLVTQSMPYAIQEDILKSRSVTISQNLDVKFRYNLKNVSRYSEVDFKTLQRSLLSMVKYLLKDESSNEVSEKLTNYCENLRNGKYTELIQLYAEYIPIYDELFDNPDVHKTIAQQSKLIKLWQKVRAVLNMLKPFAVTLLVVLAILYLLYTTFGYNKEDKSQYNTYKSIGTLDIKEYQNG